MNSVLLLRFLSWVAAAVFQTQTSRKNISEELEVNNINKSAHWKQEVRTRK
jgi:hypothetical protein